MTDVANGVEFAAGEVYISVGPDLWRTKDKDGDGMADEKTSISHGWIVHVGFSGHGMSGGDRRSAGAHLVGGRRRRHERYR